MANNYEQFSTRKKLVLDYYNSLDKSDDNEISTVLNSHIGDDYIWRDYHPFNELSNAKDVFEIFWQPFRHAFNNMQRRMDIFIAGTNEIDNFESV